jgi:hypothetical protein
VVTDPLRRIPTSARLWLAAVLCLAPMGLIWSTSVTPGTTLFGDCGYSDGPYCTPDQYLPGSASTTTVAQSPIRVFLVVAVLLLAVCAATPRTERTRRLARVATGALALAALLSASHGASRPLVCVLAALALAAPPAWPAREQRRPALLAKRPPAG